MLARLPEPIILPLESEGFPRGDVYKRVGAALFKDPDLRTPLFSLKRKIPQKSVFVPDGVCSPLPVSPQMMKRSAR